MVKRKDRPVLFEIVNRKEPRGGSATVRTRPARPRIARPPAARPAAAERRAAPRLREGGAAAPVLRFANGRLHVNAGWVGLTGTALGLLMLLGVAFQGGVRFAQGGWANTGVGADLEQLLAGPADPSVLSVPESERRNGTRRVATPPLARSGEPAGPPADEPSAGGAPMAVDAAAALEKGAHHVVVQHFPNSKKREAEAAAGFLTENGVVCVVDASGPDLRVIANEAFRIDQTDRGEGRSEQKRCDALKGRVRELGKQYLRAGGGYSFEGCREQRQ